MEIKRCGSQAGGGSPTDCFTGAARMDRSSHRRPCPSLLRFLQQPLMIMLGLLTGAGAAKSGYGAWVAGGILSFFPVYFGAVVTCMATRSVAAWVTRMRRYEVAGF